jgi:hypothetical protein
MPTLAVNRALVEGDDSSVFTKEEFRHLLPKTLQELLEKAESDPALKRTLQDFVEKTFSYSRITGEILDLAGADNVTVFQNNNVWNYRIVDALYPGHARALERARFVLRKALTGSACS